MTTEPTPSPTPAASVVGQIVSGRYRIRELLGEGGMGAVYLAEHTHMRKRVALKLLHAEMSKDEEVLARFKREAEAAAHVEHPNVAAATDFGQTEEGAFFLVLEYVEGKSLREAIDIGAIATKVSFTPGVGFWNTSATFCLRGPTMWKLIGRPVSSTNDQKGS